MAAYPRQAFLRLAVGAGNAAGERCLEVAGIEGGEGRDEVCRGAVGKGRRAGGGGLAAGLEEVEQAADLQFRSDQDPGAAGGDRADVVR